MLSQQHLQAGVLPPLPKKTQGSVSVTQATDLSFQGNAITRPGQAQVNTSVALVKSSAESPARSKPKYRAEPQRQPFNEQIHNGNTYAYPQLPLNAQPNAAEIEKQHALKKKIQTKRKLALQQRLRTPDAVPGRKHIEIQTELYLEELADQVPEAYAATQTDAFIDRAPSPLYMPKKTGVDATTQIIDGELFDFDFEITPIVEVLVAKTLEQAQLEVIEETELGLLAQYRQEFEERRNAELTEVKRLESLENRRAEEKSRRLNEQLRIQYEKEQAAEKVAARAFSQAYLRNLIPSVLDELADNGFIYNAVEKEVTHLFIPWISNCVEQKLNRVRTARSIVDNLLLHALQKRQETYENARLAALAPKAAAEAEAAAENAELNAFEVSQSENVPETPAVASSVEVEPKEETEATQEAEQVASSAEGDSPGASQNTDADKEQAAISTPGASESLETENSNEANSSLGADSSLLQSEEVSGSGNGDASADAPTTAAPELETEGEPAAEL